MSPSASDLVRQMRSVLFRRGRRPGLRTAKTTLAAVLSFVVAQRLGTSPQPVLAPLTAWPMEVSWRDGHGPGV